MRVPSIYYNVLVAAYSAKITVVLLEAACLFAKMSNVVAVR